jgi:hypothetical protein
MQGQLSKRNPEPTAARGGLTEKGIETFVIPALGTKDAAWETKNSSSLGVIVAGARQETLT